MRNLEDGNLRLHAKVDAISRQIMLNTVAAVVVGVVVIVLTVR